jgi:hypothetical protein
MDRPQDAFNSLVEYCRLGRLRLMVLRSNPNPNRTVDISFKPDMVLTNLPVYDFGELSPEVTEGHVRALEAVMAGQFHLPYPRCGFLHRTGGRGQESLPEQYRLKVGRFYIMLCDESDGIIQIDSFLRHDNHTAWSQQVWQG